MGNLIGSSSNINSFNISTGKSKFKSALDIAFPSYYIKDVVINDSDVDYVTKSWNIVMNCEEVEEFLKAKRELNFEYSSCLTWFFDLFYGHFFDLCPDARSMFVHVSMAAQGRLLAGVISTALGLITKPDKLRKRLIAVVDSHNPKKIYSNYYGIMGEALLWALQRVLGERFEENIKLAWIRVYSILLSIMIPRAVAYETKYNSRHSSLKRDSSSSTSSSSNRSISNMKYVIETRIRNSLTLRRAHGADRNLSNASPECPFKRSENVSGDSSGVSHRSVIKSTTVSRDMVEAKHDDDDEENTASCPVKLANSKDNSSFDSDDPKKQGRVNKFILKKAYSAFGRLTFHSSTGANHQAPRSSLDSTHFSNIEDFPKPDEDNPGQLRQHQLHAHHHLHDNKITPSSETYSSKKMSVSEHGRRGNRKRIGCSKSLDSTDRIHFEVDSVREECEEGDSEETEKEKRCPYKKKTEKEKRCPYKFGAPPASSLFQPHHSSQNSVRNYRSHKEGGNILGGVSYESGAGAGSRASFSNRDHSTLVLADNSHTEFSLPTSLHLHSSATDTKHPHANKLSPLYGHHLKSIVQRSEAGDLSEEEDE